MLLSLEKVMRFKSLAHCSLTMVVLEPESNSIFTCLVFTLFLTDRFGDFPTLELESIIGFTGILICSIGRSREGGMTIFPWIVPSSPARCRLECCRWFIFLFLRGTTVLATSCDASTSPQHDPISNRAYEVKRLQHQARCCAEVLPTTPAAGCTLVEFVVLGAEGACRLRLLLPLLPPLPPPRLALVLL